MVAKVFALSGVAFVVLASLSSCAAIVGIKSRSAAGEACADCNEKACATELGACRANDECSAWLACDAACEQGDAECHAHCAAAVSPANSGILVGVQACGATTCATDCQVSCGGVVVRAPDSSAASCQACVAQKCCTQAQACGAAGECWAIEACQRQATGPDNAVTCADTEHPGGVPAKTGLDNCVTQGCAAECALGAYWGCVGKMSWPRTPKSAVTIQYKFTDTSPQKTPIAGLQVRACAKNDLDCAHPFNTTPIISDVQGHLSITMPPTTDAGFDGYIEVVDPSTDASKAVETALIFEGAPLGDDLPTREIGLISKAVIAQLAGLAGVTLDPSRGFIGTAVFDCNAIPAAQMTVSLDTRDPQTHVFYFRGSLANPTATDTDSTGALAFVNVLPGFATLTATSEQLRRPMITSKLGVRGNAISLLQITPNPEN